MPPEGGVDLTIVSRGYSVLHGCLTHGMRRMPARKDIAYLGATVNHHLARSLPVGEIIATDPARIKSLNLLAREIIERNIPGEVAELGVYRGDFARRISSLFPDRKLYLFDTFEGFDTRDLTSESEQDLQTDFGDFSRVNVRNVLSRIPNPLQCIVKPGYFPESLDGLEETFSFVSIDTDLYKPTYEGLCYFYPRLAAGGYIMVHDYGPRRYQGVKMAVRQFSDECKAPYTPLTDTNGSVVFGK
ncbi:MAG: TylF/MycF/NovP-related O-methyltransferase [Methanomicrobiales archaeon]